LQARCREIRQIANYARQRTDVGVIPQV
jgi:hypothetical protein